MMIWRLSGGAQPVTDPFQPSRFLQILHSSVPPLAALSCSVQGQTVTCPLNELQNGGTSGQATITVTVIASGSPQQIVNTASALTVLPQTDSNTTNNSA